jgi:hypothetical protein
MRVMMKMMTTTRMKTTMNEAGGWFAAAC